MADGIAGPQLVVLDRGPWQIADDVYATGIARRQIAAQTIGMPYAQPGRSQPVGAGSGGSRTAAGSPGLGGRASGP